MKWSITLEATTAWGERMRTVKNSEVTHRTRGAVRNLVIWVVWLARRP
jgi:hypothetical protein